MPTAFSHLAGADVDTASEAWRHECECRYILDMPSREHRLLFLYGREEKWSNGQKRVVVRGIAHTRGMDAAKRLQADATKLHALLREQK